MHFPPDIVKFKLIPERTGREAIHQTNKLRADASVFTAFYTYSLTKPVFKERDHAQQQKGNRQKQY